MTRRARWLLALGVGALGLAPMGGAAQEQKGPIRLSVGEAVELARDENEGVRLARSQRQLANAQYVQARADALPQISGSVVYNRTLASIFDGISLGPPPEEGEGEEGGVALPFGQANAWTAVLSVSQPLYSGGRVGTALRIAERVQDAADLGITDAEAAVTFEARSAYFRTLLADELVVIAQESFALADEQFQEVALRRQQGTTSEFDELRARVTRDNLEPPIIEAENARRLAELDLKRILRLPPEVPLELTTRLSTELLDVDREALRAAVLRRPGLRALDETVEARRDAIRIAASARLPSVSGVANFGYQSFPTGFTPLDTDWRRDWNLGLQISLPVFDGLRTRGAIDQAQVELLQAELQRSQAQGGAAIELESALADLDAALARSTARQATVEQARRALELAELRSGSGLATQLEVSDARLMLEQARVNEVQALHDYINALARLEQVTGGLVPLLDARLPGGN